jgi:putative transposase
MPKSPVRVNVAARDRQTLNELLHGGMQPVRVVLRAMTLLHLSRGVTAPRIAAALFCLTAKAVRDIAHRYEAGGLERALFDKPRPGAAELLTPAEKQRIVAMVCAGPPDGRARWTVRLIAAEAVKRKLVRRVGRETIRVLLQSHDLKPWREKNVVSSKPGRRLSRPDGGGSRSL